MGKFCNQIPMTFNQTNLPAFWEICMQVKKQQLKLHMEQWVGSKSR